MSETALYKTCAKCGRTLFIDKFPMDRQKKDGRYHLCRECAYEKYQAYMEKQVPTTLFIDSKKYVRLDKVETIEVNGKAYVAVGEGE